MLPLRNPVMKMKEDLPCGMAAARAANRSQYLQLRRWACPTHRYTLSKVSKDSILGIQRVFSSDRVAHASQMGRLTMSTAKEGKAQCKFSVPTAAVTTQIVQVVACRGSPHGLLLALSRLVSASSLFPSTTCTNEAKGHATNVDCAAICGQPQAAGSAARSDVLLLLQSQRRNASDHRCSRFGQPLDIRDIHPH